MEAIAEDSDLLQAGKGWLAAARSSNSQLRGSNSELRELLELARTLAAKESRLGPDDADRKALEAERAELVQRAKASLRPIAAIGQPPPELARALQLPGGRGLPDVVVQPDRSPSLPAEPAGLAEPTPPPLSNPAPPPEPALPEVPVPPEAALVQLQPEPAVEGQDDGAEAAAGAPCTPKAAASRLPLPPVNLERVRPGEAFLEPAQLQVESASSSARTAATSEPFTSPMMLPQTSLHGFSPGSDILLAREPGSSQRTASFDRLAEASFAWAPALGGPSPSPVRAGAEKLGACGVFSPAGMSVLETSASRTIMDASALSGQVLETSASRTIMDASALSGQTTELSAERSKDLSGLSLLPEKELNTSLPAPVAVVDFEGAPSPSCKMELEGGPDKLQPRVCWA